MTKRVATRLSSALAVGVLLFVAPAVSQAIPITSVSVTIGTTTFCDTTVGCANQIWNLGGGVNVGSGGFNSLVLTQTGTTTNNFNFDTSDLQNLGSATITINGTIVFTDTAHILTAPTGPDPLTGAFQEAHEWAFVDAKSGVALYLGYADTAHTNAFTDTIGPNGLPDNPWDGSPNTRFIGNATPGSGCLRPGITSCYDAGALRIEAAAVPEPASILLVATGLLGVAFVSRKRARALLGRS